jgi:2-iminobutanoate/2-iminopropanoate deaminase
LGVAQAQSPNGVPAPLRLRGLVPRRASRRLRLCRRHARHRSGDQGLGAGSASANCARAFINLKTIAQSEGAALQDCVRLTVYVSDLHRYAPMVDKAQAELWGGPPYPPRTMIEVQPPVRRRYRRDRQRVLRAGEGVTWLSTRLLIQSWWMTQTPRPPAYRIDGSLGSTTICETAGTSANFDQFSPPFELR